VDIIFYLRSDRQHIIPSDTIMTVYLLILKLCDVLIRQWAFFSTQDQMDNIYYLVTLSWLCLLLIIILCDVLIDNGCFFFLRSDEKYSLDSDAIMAVLVYTITLCDVLIDSWRSFLLKVR
jgi:hypothetical protein